MQDKLSYQQPSQDQVSYQQPSQDQLSYQQSSLSDSHSRSLFRGSSVLSYHGVPTPPPSQDLSQSPQAGLSEPQVFQTFSKFIAQPVPPSASPAGEPTIAPSGQYQPFYNPSPSLFNAVKQDPTIEPKSPEESTSNVVIKPFTFFNTPAKQETHETFFSPLVSQDFTLGHQANAQQGIPQQARPQQSIPIQAKPQQGAFQVLSQQAPILQSKPDEALHQPEVDSFLSRPVFTVFASKPQSVDNINVVQQQQQLQQEQQG